MESLAAGARHTAAGRCLPARGERSGSKWTELAKCSADAALRDITDLLTLGVLRKTDAGGRSTSYELHIF